MQYLGKKKISICLTLAMLVGTFVPVLAEYDSNPECPYDFRSGRYIISLSGMGIIRSNGNTQDAGLSLVSTSIPKGTYKVTLASYDNHSDKPFEGQGKESWHVILGNNTGATLGYTPSISDLPENRDYFKEVVSENFVLRDTATWAIAYHSAFPSNELDTVAPVCAVFDDVLGMQLADVTTAVVETQSATIITAGSALLHGSLDSTDADVIEHWFEWGTAPTELSHSTRHYSDTNTKGDYADEINNLNSNATYYYRAAARVSAGTVHGKVLSFTTKPSPLSDREPVVTTRSATSINEDSAKLNASVNPKGLATDIWFEYGRTQNLGLVKNHVAGQQGDAAADHGQSISNLLPNTKYYFRVVAENEAGISYGSILSFTTGTEVSANNVAITKLATGITSTAGTMNAQVIPADSLSTSVWFDWGRDKTFRGKTTVRTVAQSSAPLAEKLTGLTPNTLYYYRVVMQNAAGTTYGETLSFRTSNTPVTSPTPTPTVTPASPAPKPTATPKPSATPSKSPTVSPRPSPTATAGAAKPTSTPKATVFPTVSAAPSGTTSTSTSPFSLNITTLEGERIGRDQTITYTVTAKNNSPQNIQNIRLTVVLPAGVTYVSDTVSPFTSQADVLVHDLGKLASQEERKVTFRAKVDNDANDGEVLTTTVVGSYTNATGASKEVTAYVLNTVDRSKDVNVGTASLTDRVKNLFSNKLTAGIIGTIVVLIIILVILYILERRARNNTPGGGTA